jgi:CRP-like cAMP-binding protein
MTDSEAVMNLLRKVPLFANLKDEDKVCIEETEEWRLPAGEMLVEEGKHAEYFFVLLEGEIVVWKKHGDQEIVVYRNRPGAFFGEVPLLLGRPYMLSARAERDCLLIVFPEEAFWKLLRLCPAISGEIFRAMATRLRNIEGSARQQEKLEALGTMSAGLAHELNNPSAAAQRIAVHLGEVIQMIQSVAHRLHHTLEHEHWDRLIALVGEVLRNPSAGKQHHSFEQSDSEDALAAWLREGGVTDAWKIAPVLVGAGLDTSALVSLREDLPKNGFGDAVRWIALRMTIQTLLDDAEQCTGRIAGLVDAVRSSARQERAGRPRSQDQEPSPFFTSFCFFLFRGLGSPGSLDRIVSPGCYCLVERRFTRSTRRTIFSPQGCAQPRSPHATRQRPMRRFLQGRLVEPG